MGETPYDHIADSSVSETQRKAREDSKNHSDDAQNFAAGTFDEKKYQIVDITTEYYYTYKNIETGTNEFSIFSFHVCLTFKKSFGFFFQIFFQGIP